MLLKEAPGSWSPLLKQWTSYEKKAGFPKGRLTKKVCLLLIKFY